MKYLKTSQGCCYLSHAKQHQRKMKLVFIALTSHSETRELVLLGGQSVKPLLVSDSTTGLTAHQLLSLKRDMAASLLYCVVCFPAL